MPACLLDRSACLDARVPDPAVAKRSFRILVCQDKAAIGFEDKLYDDKLQGIEIGARLTDAALRIYSLAFIGANSPFADIAAVDGDVIVFTVSFPGDFGRTSYLIYDAVSCSIRLIPLPGDKSWRFALSTRLLIARSPSAHDGLAPDYALVHMGRLLVDDGWGLQDSLLLWRPSSTSTPWSECKKATFPTVQEKFYQTDMEFSFDGHCYWVDLLCGVLYCKSDALFGNNSDEVIKIGFIDLPVKHQGEKRNSGRVPQPQAFRTMGVVNNSIKFVSMDGFLEPVHLQHRTVTIWERQGLDSRWQIEREIPLEPLWRNMEIRYMLPYLTPMCPLLCLDNKNIIYIMLDEYQENRRLEEFVPPIGHHLLAVDILHGDILHSTCLEDVCCSLDLVSCDCSKSIYDGQRHLPGDTSVPVPLNRGVHHEVGKQS